MFVLDPVRAFADPSHRRRNWTADVSICRLTLVIAVYEYKTRLPDERTCCRGGLFHRISFGNDCCDKWNGYCADRGSIGRSSIGVGLEDGENLVSPPHPCSALGTHTFAFSPDTGDRGHEFSPPSRRQGSARLR
jgi:hypothetical protein